MLPVLHQKAYRLVQIAKRVASRPLVCDVRIADELKILQIRE